LDGDPRLPIYLRLRDELAGKIAAQEWRAGEAIPSESDLAGRYGVAVGTLRKTLDLLDEIAENRKDDYAKVWEHFGKVLKEGVGEDHANKERIARLLRFRSTQADDESVSLVDYLARAKEGQDKIYYLSADSLPAAKASPHLEVFRKKGVEVLLLTDRVDEWVVSNLFEFEGKSLVSVARGQVDLSAIKSEGEEPVEAPKDEEAKPFLERLKKVLEGRAKDVRASQRLVDSPACLVADEGDMNANLARMLKQMGQEVPESQPILEVNLGHPLVKRMEGEEGERFDELAGLLLDQAVLLDGGQLSDPAGFVRRVNGLLFG